MNTVTTFFSKELNDLEASIHRLERTLSNHPPNALNYPMLCAELDMYQRARQHLTDLLNDSADPITSLLTCRLHYNRALRNRLNSRTKCASSRQLLQSDEWWDSLGEAQYFSGLIRRYEGWLETQPIP
jgi:hypothetical protein